MDDAGILPGECLDDGRVLIDETAEQRPSARQGSICQVIKIALQHGPHGDAAQLPAVDLWPGQERVGAGAGGIVRLDDRGGIGVGGGRRIGGLLGFSDGLIEFGKIQILHVSCPARDG